jgi:hypothetical protein
VYPVSALYVRDPKDHGTKKTVEGPRLEADAKVAIILTDPEGLPIAMKRLRALGYDPCVVLNWEAFLTAVGSDKELTP